MFIVYVEELNLYSWRLLSASGRVLATSRSYPTKGAHPEQPRQWGWASTTVRSGGPVSLATIVRRRRRQ